MFIVRAKAATYVGAGQAAENSRLGSHDLGFTDSPWQYRDSYFGGTDFIGQEVVWHHDNPIWAMNYYGRVLRDDLIDSARAAQVIRAALTALYAEGRFLGGFRFRHDGFDYTDDTRGDAGSFSGIERITVSDTCAYQLDYYGGLIRA